MNQHIPRRNGVLESEETGFSAIEEEVKGIDLVSRPTVYAGMQSKLDHKEYSKNIGKYEKIE